MEPPPPYSGFNEHRRNDRDDAENKQKDEDVCYFNYLKLVLSVIDISMQLNVIDQ